MKLCLTNYKLQIIINNDYSTVCLTTIYIMRAVAVLPENEYE